MPVRSRRPTERLPLPAAPADVAGVTPHTVALHGDLDLAGAATARPDLMAAAVGSAPVVVDLREVGYLSSAGVGLLVEVTGTAAARGVPVTIRIAPGTAAARVLWLTGLAATLPVTS